ncbi:MAG: hypothetical protein O2954_06335 [bacterium]|nr:hypothetical protein [bacterium]
MAGTSVREVLSVEDVVLAKRDVWGEAAMAQENGPSYAFFERLLPPIRYVNTTFRHCPIVLGAPGALCKARYVSNGSGINLSAEGGHGWKDVGFPITLRVGRREVLYGAFPERLDGSRYAEGYLPIVQSRYEDAGCVYAQEVFASVDPALAESGVVFVKFSLVEGTAGDLTAHVKWQGRKEFSEAGLCDDAGRTLVQQDGSWRWDGAWNFLKTSITQERPAYLAVFTEPKEVPEAKALDAEEYERQRQACVERWEEVLGRGMRVEVPEAMVNHAWQSLVVGNYQMLRDDALCYSAHNQYEKLYVSEGGDAIRSLLLWGHVEDGRRMILPLLDYTRKGLEYHQAGFKLQLLAHYFWLTKDVSFVHEQKERWAAQVERILEHREQESGLFPRERYCGDVPTFVYSLNSNANGWRGLRDAAAMLAEVGEAEEAERLLGIASEFREKILAAVEKSESKDPPFIPVALFGEERVYEELTADKAGSYWNLMAPYILDSRVFGVGRDREQEMLDYLHEHGGICMGMIRCRPNMEFWVNKSNVNNLYGLRYTMALLRKDHVDRALVSFYGKLAQGMSRDTFLDGEASCLVPADPFGRQVFLPPNSAANAYFLWMLRYLLVQDWDLDDDGKPDTLRLMFATPRRWLADGETIRIVDAPTAFGKVSVRMVSRLSEGEIVAEVDLPERCADRILLRARVPDGWCVDTAQVEGVLVEVDERGTVDLSGRVGKRTVLFRVQPI